MKKNNLLKVLVAALWGALVVSALFTSCSKPAIDENGFCLDSETAAKMAKKNNQSIIVIATMEGDDQYSSQLVQNVLNDSRFKEEIVPNYTILRLDFSEKAYKETAFKENATKEEAKIAEEKADRLEKNMIFASNLSLQVTPSIFLMSKDMYFITKFDFTTADITTYDGFKTLLENQQPVIDEFNNRIAATKNGTKEERLAAIDFIYEATKSVHRIFLSDLVDDYIKLDKKNETGKLNKYLLDHAEYVGSKYFAKKQFDKAAEVYAKLGKDKRLEPADKQICYYLASFVLASTETADTDKILEYLQTAIDVYPDGPDTPQLQKTMEQLKSVIETKKAEEAEKENADSASDK